MKTLLLTLFMPLIVVFAASTDGLAEAQEDRCSAERAAVIELLKPYNNTFQALVVSEDQMERAYGAFLRATHQLSRYRAVVASVASLLIFTPDPSPHKLALDEFRKSFEERAKVLNQEAIKARSALLASFEDWTEKNDAAMAIVGRYLQANNQLSSCLASPPRGPANTRPAGPPSAVRGSVRFVNVTTNPENLKPSGGWSWVADGGKMTLTHPSIGQQSFSWTDPPKQIGPDGAEITLTVESRSNPNGSALAGLSVKGDFVVTPTPAHVEARSEKQKPASNSLTVTLKIPPGFSGRELQLIIGADYGPISFIYHYEVIR